MATVDGLQCASAETSLIFDCVDDIPLETPQEKWSGQPAGEHQGDAGSPASGEAAPGMETLGEDADSAPGGAGLSPSSSKSSSGQALLDAYGGQGEGEDPAAAEVAAEGHSLAGIVAANHQEQQAAGEGLSWADAVAASHQIQEEGVTEPEAEGGGVSTPQKQPQGDGGSAPASGKKQPIRLSWLGTGPKSSPHPKVPSPKKELEANMEGREDDEEEEQEQDNDDVDAITELLLDPRKTRHAITKGAYAGKELRINPMVKEALNLIISSPSPKVSALIRQHRKLERVNGIHAPSLAFSPHKSSTYSSSGQRNRWGSAADRAALAQLETHNKISKALSSPNKHASVHTPVAGPCGSMDTSMNGEPLIQGLQDSPSSSHASPHPVPATENQPPLPSLPCTPPLLSGLQADDSMLLEPLPGLQDDALEVCTSPEAEQEVDVSGLQAVAACETHEDTDVPPRKPIGVAEPKVLRFKALEHLDLVESLVEEIEFIAEKAVAADRPVFGQETATKLGEGLQALRGVQISVIHDDFESAKGGIGECGGCFSRGGYEGAKGDLEKLLVRVGEAQVRARIQAEEQETLDEDNRKMFEAVRGNDALQKAGFCLADERYDHALAFIARAEGAFLRSGAGEGDGQEDGMLAFLRDMAKRVVHSKSAAETKAQHASRNRQYASSADLVVRSRGDTATSSAEPASEHVPHMVGPAAGEVQEVSQTYPPPLASTPQLSHNGGRVEQPSRFGSLGHSTGSLPQQQHAGVPEGAAHRSSSSGVGGGGHMTGPGGEVLKPSSSWTSGVGSVGKENRWGVVSGADFRSTPNGTPTKTTPKPPSQYQPSPDVDAMRGFGGGLVGAAADLPSMSINDRTNV